MELTILGTGNAMVTECYNTCFVLEENDQYFMVDGGGGSTLFRQLRHCGMDWRKMRTIFVTHKHLDHITGILWMMRMICQEMNRGEYEGEAVIYSHDEVIRLLQEMAKMLLKKAETDFIGRRLHLVSVADGEQKEILGKTVTFFDIHSTKAKQFGFSMDLGEGRKLTCCGDEPYHPSEQAYARNSTWLLHEAFCLDSQAERFHPYEKHHSTVKDACQQAQQLQVKNLLLYHTEDVNIAHRRELYQAEGKQYFQGNLFVPEDLERISLDS